MKCNWFTRGVVSLATVGTLTPSSQAAAPHANQRPTISRSAADSTPQAAVQDVALGHGGTLSGQVLDAQGNPVAAAGVSVRQNGLEAARASTDRDGKFAVGGLRGGLYQVVSGEGASNYRLWAENTAPPAAQTSALVIAQQDLVRGQTPLKSVATSNAVIIGGIAAAALSIPFIVHAARDKQSGS